MNYTRLTQNDTHDETHVHTKWHIRTHSYTIIHTCTYTYKLPLTKNDTHDDIHPMTHTRWRTYTWISRYFIKPHNYDNLNIDLSLFFNLTYWKINKNKKIKNEINILENQILMILSSFYLPLFHLNF